mgnify:CR=1 FL=1
MPIKRRISAAPTSASSALPVPISKAATPED